MGSRSMGGGNPNRSAPGYNSGRGEDVNSRSSSSSFDNQRYNANDGGSTSNNGNRSNDSWKTAAALESLGDGKTYNNNNLYEVIVTREKNPMGSKNNASSNLFRNRQDRNNSNDADDRDMERREAGGGEGNRYQYPRPPPPPQQQQQQYSRKAEQQQRGDLNAFQKTNYRQRSGSNGPNGGSYNQSFDSGQRSRNDQQGMQSGQQPPLQRASDEGRPPLGSGRRPPPPQYNTMGNQMQMPPSYQQQQPRQPPLPRQSIPPPLRPPPGNFNYGRNAYSAMPQKPMSLPLSEIASRKPPDQASVPFIRGGT